MHTGQQSAYNPDPRTGLVLFILVAGDGLCNSARGNVWMWVWFVWAHLMTRKRMLRLSDVIPTSVAFLALFTITTHALWSSAPYLAQWGIIRISRYGVARGFLLAVRLVLIASSAKLLAEISTPLKLAGALDWLLRPMQRLGLYSPDLPMLMAIGSRFVPQLHSDARRLVTLWQLRRSGKDSSELKETLLSVGHEILLPLFRISWRRAMILGEALALRHYNPGRQGSLHPYRLNSADRRAWAGTVLFCLLAFVAG